MVKGRYPYVALTLLSVLLSAAALLGAVGYYHANQAAQRHQAELIEQRLCTTFAKLSAEKPPPGNPLTNPARAFDQGQHAILAQVGPDIGCTRRTP